MCVVQTELDGWVIVFESGVRIKNVHPDHAKQVIVRLDLLK